jgi:putative ABC transport system permease protein
MGIKPVFRRLIRSPLFTGLTLITLGLGIGANSAIFSVIQGVLLKPLPYNQPEELISVSGSAPGINFTDTGMAAFLYFTYRDESRTFQDVGMYGNDTDSVTGVGEPEEVRTLDVTYSVLSMLGVQPALGRLFTAADESTSSPQTVILTYGYWQRKFGGDASVVGRPLLIDGKPCEIVGVLPSAFRFLDVEPSLALVLPLRLDRTNTFLGQFNYGGIARLKPGVTIRQASTDIARMIPLSYQRFQPFPGYTVKMFEDARLAPYLRPLKEMMTGQISTVLWVLMGTVGLVLLIACANVANLLLVRVDGRQHELAVRAALGASRRQIARELLLESTVLGLGGGLLGLFFAYAGLRLLIALAPVNLPRVDLITIDGTVLLFTLIISLISGALFGAVPIFKYAGAQLGTALRSEGRTLSHSKERHRARSTLVIVQIALTLVLLIGSGLMIRTFQALRHVNPGFTRPEEVLTVRISIPSALVSDGVKVTRMEQNILDRIAAIQGVSSVGLMNHVPMEDGGSHDLIFVEDHAYTEGQLPPLRMFKFVSPGLLKTMGNPLVAGRDFTWTDLYEKRPVTMVSENLARELWGDPTRAIGKRVRESLKAPWREIVGVVADEHEDGLDRKAPTMAIWPILMDKFWGDRVHATGSLAYMIRSSRAGSSGLLREVSQAVWSVNPNLPIAHVRTLREVYDGSLARTSFTLLLLGIAGGMALLLGLAGIYGVIAYSVSQRTREIGIRIALGAQNTEVRRMFVRHGARLAVIGIACGIGAALALTRFMSSMLFDVSPLDPLTYLGVSLGLVSAAVFASYLPAVRATMVDPVVALRSE